MILHADEDVIVCPFPNEVKGMVLGDTVILVDPKYMEECREILDNYNKNVV